MDKAENHAHQLVNIARAKSYPNVDRHSFLVEKARLIRHLKQSIQHLKQLDEDMIQLAINDLFLKHIIQYQALENYLQL